jgi:2-methylisoborneol synthase
MAASAGSAPRLSSLLRAICAPRPPSTSACPGGDAGPADPPGGEDPATRAPGVSGLYCPEPVRDDPPLGELVNERLVTWARDVGIYADRIETVRAANFGRMMMLAHPDTEDADRLLVAAKCALTEWATDDHYCDDASAGADTRLLGARLGVACAAFEKPHLPLEYAAQCERGMGEDPVRVALRSAYDHLASYAEPSQLGRLRHELAVLFAAYGQEGSWRTSGHTPAVWEYLAHRQLNSFLPCLALVDAVGGYQLPAVEYSAPPVRRAVKLAALASTLVNDLYSATKNDREDGVDYSLPTVIAAEDRCGLAEATEKAVGLHNELMHAYEGEAAMLATVGSPQLRRYLAGVWAWLGGNHAWHRDSDRYA